MRHHDAYMQTIVRIFEFFAHVLRSNSSFAAHLNRIIEKVYFYNSPIKNRIQVCYIICELCASPHIFSFVRLFVLASLFRPLRDSHSHFIFINNIISLFIAYCNEMTNYEFISSAFDDDDNGSNNNCVSTSICMWSSVFVFLSWVQIRWICLLNVPKCENSYTHLAIHITLFHLCLHLAQSWVFQFQRMSTRTHSWRFRVRCTFTAQNILNLRYKFGILWVFRKFFGRFFLQPVALFSILVFWRGDDVVAFACGCAITLVHILPPHFFSSPHSNENEWLWVDQIELVRPLWQ